MTSKEILEWVFVIGLKHHVEIIDSGISALAILPLHEYQDIPESVHMPFMMVL